MLLRTICPRSSPHIADFVLGCAQSRCLEMALMGSAPNHSSANRALIRRTISSRRSSSSSQRDRNLKARRSTIPKNGVPIHFCANRTWVHLFM